MYNLEIGTYIFEMREFIDMLVDKKTAKFTDAKKKKTEKLLTLLIKCT